MIYIIFELLHNLFDLSQVSLSKMAKHWDSFLSHCISQRKVVVVACRGAKLGVERIRPAPGRAEVYLERRWELWEVGWTEDAPLMQLPLKLARVVVPIAVVVARTSILCARLTGQGEICCKGMVYQLAVCIDYCCH
jgi:hypothetical protein